MKPKKFILILIVVLLIATTFIGCSQKASKYTEEQHMQRISERIQKRYIDGDEKIRDFRVPRESGNAFIRPTGFEVYPLYNNNDELSYCLVEFQPCGFLYVSIQDERLTAFSWLGASASMYTLSRQTAWTPCKINKETDETIWEEKSGVKTEYYHSPFYERGVIEERKYLILCDYNSYNEILIPTIIKEGEYINLYSSEEFEIINGQATEEPAISQSILFINKKEFDL